MRLEICSVDGCGKPVRARGWCSTHHQRWRVTGTVQERRLPSLDERFWLKVLKRGPDECWTWTGGHQPLGYGIIRDMVNRKNIGAHRYAYMTLVGPIPEGLHLDHLCRNPACVNPAHLEPVTPKENVQRGARLRQFCARGHEYAPDKTGQRGRCIVCRRMMERARRRKARL